MLLLALTPIYLLLELNPLSTPSFDTLSTPFQPPDPYGFPVFQAGPRQCLGMNMALFEAKVGVAMLLQEFSFELKAGEEIT